ncbi:MAG: glycosyltransferase involved in cell wall biosynthesis [Saprospiraceae bacterium]|jgi:glycosyltransferase involved in cell wall biosynthesis
MRKRKVMKSKHTVLMLTSSFPRYEGDYFGPWILEYCRELVRQECRVIVVAPRVGDCEKEVLSDVNLIIRRFDYWPKSSCQRLVHPPGMIPQIKANPLRVLQIPGLLRSFYTTAKRAIIDYKVDIIHAQWVIPGGYIGALLKKKFSLPLVVTSQGAEFYLSINHPYSWFTKYTIKKTDYLLPVSEQMAKRAVKFGADPDRTMVIPNAVNTKIFNPDVVSTFRNDYGISQEAIVILTIRRLVPEKRVQDVIEAFALLKEAHNIYLIIGGDGPEGDNLKQLVKTKGIEEKIRFIGYINNSELSPIYSASDIYVLSSAQEGLSLSLLEAMASGCIPVSTAFTGGDELIEDNYNGYIYDVGDSEALSIIVSGLMIKSSISIEDLKTNSINSIKEKYSTVIMGTLWRNIYRDLLFLSKS